ncbi:MAG: GntR family transcriptional regulator [Bifidobacteriaceae bacterium]|jgi:GntR family transcriptional regulator|nr:GntR family transcriptional regulator [Bifidobacteriaceae bacterium]
MYSAPNNVNLKAMTKRDQIVNALVERIEGGEIGPGERLAGENVLASEFQVSRGTVRQALSELQRRRLIATRSGFGSVVIYDGQSIDQGASWTRALSNISGGVTSRVLRIEVVPRAAASDLPARVPGQSFVLVERRRDAAQGEGGSKAVSLERSYVPNVGSLADLPEKGLAGGSWTASLAHAGLTAAHGERSAALRRLSEDEAAVLERPVGAPFLRTIRTSFASDESFVEHVVSLLDPDHFSFLSKFGAGA